MIACVAVPYFAATVERRDDAALAQTPLVIGGRAWEPRPVYAYSREARQHGIRPGMLLRQAQAVYPASHFLPPDGSGYRQAAGEVNDALLDFTPLVEPEPAWHPPAGARQGIPAANLALPARYYLDLEGLPAKEAVPLVQHIGRSLRQQTALAPAIGLAGRRFAAQIAAAFTRPNHIRPIQPEAEADFLAQRAIHFLPLEKEAARRLRLLGIRTLGQLAQLPPVALRRQLGPEIEPLYRLARGEGAYPIRAQTPPPAETAGHDFEAPVANRLALVAVLTRLARDLAGRLQTDVMAGGEVQLAWETESGQAQRQSQALRQPTADPNRLAVCLHQLLEQMTFPDGVTVVTVTVTHLSPARAYQLPLFGSRPEEAGTLKGLVARLQAKFGQALFYETAVPAPDHPIPERRSAWRPIACDPILA